MEITQQYKPTLHSLLSVIAGLVFIYLSIVVTGLGAAIAIPESVLNPMAKLSLTVALSVVDLITIGIPLAICFVMYAWLLKSFLKTINYYLVAAPYIMLLLFSFLEPGFSSNYSIYFVAQVFAKDLPFLVCVYLLGKASNNKSAA
jgi:hypothetical protein